MNSGQTPSRAHDPKWGSSQDKHSFIASHIREGDQVLGSPLSPSLLTANLSLDGVFTVIAHDRVVPVIQVVLIGCLTGDYIQRHFPEPDRQAVSEINWTTLRVKFDSREVLEGFVYCNIAAISSHLRV